MQAKRDSSDGGASFFSGWRYNINGRRLHKAQNSPPSQIPFSTRIIGEERKAHIHENDRGRCQRRCGEIRCIVSSRGRSKCKGQNGKECTSLGVC